jgi:hypothetical protein
MSGNRWRFLAQVVVNPQSLGKEWVVTEETLGVEILRILESDAVAARQGWLGDAMSRAVRDFTADGLRIMQLAQVGP